MENLLHPITASSHRLTVNLSLWAWTKCKILSPGHKVAVLSCGGYRLFKGTCWCYPCWLFFKWCLSACFKVVKMTSLELYSKVRLSWGPTICRSLKEENWLWYKNCIANEVSIIVFAWHTVSGMCVSLSRHVIMSCQFFIKCFSFSEWLLVEEVVVPLLYFWAKRLQLMIDLLWPNLQICVFKSLFL